MPTTIYVHAVGSKKGDHKLTKGLICGMERTESNFSIVGLEQGNELCYYIRMHLSEKEFCPPVSKKIASC